MSETPDEERLLADLARALGPDPLPPGLVERAEGLVAWMGVDAELAALVEDRGGELAGMRGSGVTDDLLSFRTSDGSIAIEATIEDDQLVGQVLAGSPTEVELVRLEGGARATGVDDLGRFVFARPARGPTRIRLMSESGQAVTTDWFVL